MTTEIEPEANELLDACHVSFGQGQYLHLIKLLMHASPSLTTVAHGIFDKLSLPADSAYRVAAYEVAQLAEEGEQPAYHNKTHTLAVMVNGWLIAETVFKNLSEHTIVLDPPLDRLDIADIVLACLAHDIYHTGKEARPFQLEQKASHLAAPIFTRALGGEKCQELCAYILATDFRIGAPQVAAEWEREKKQGIYNRRTLKALIVTKADVASSAAIDNEAESDRLARELGLQEIPIEVRLNFLEKVKFDLPGLEFLESRRIRFLKRLRGRGSAEETQMLNVSRIMQLKREKNSIGPVNPQ